MLSGDTIRLQLALRLQGPDDEYDDQFYFMFTHAWLFFNPLKGVAWACHLLNLFLKQKLANTFKRESIW